MTRRVAEWKGANPSLATLVSDEDIARLINEQVGTMMGEPEIDPMNEYQAALIANANRDFMAKMWADAAARKQAAGQLGYSYASLAQQKTLQEQQMAQAAELARLQREQQQREMAAMIGRTIAQAMSQQWQTGLPYELPRGTEYAPGMGYGGPMQALQNLAGLQYRPTQIAPSPGPSRAQMSAWLDEAISRFGPGG